MTTEVVDASTKPNTQLVRAVEEAGLEASSATNLINAFAPSFASAMTLAAKAAEINVTDATQVTEIKASRALRLELKAIRVDAEKLRKRLKEDSLRVGRGIDRVHSVIESIISPAEEKMKAQEEFAERVEAARRAALTETRSALLKPYVQDTSIYPLGTMDEPAFQSLLNGHRMAHEAALAEARRLEAERIERERAEAAERERLRVENERLRAEREAAEHRLAEERKAAEAAAKKAADQARKEREAAELAAKAEREARELLEREAKAAQEAKAKAEREEAERVRKAALAPDADKLMVLAEAIERMSLPTVKSEQAASVIARVRASLGDLASSIRAQAKAL